MTHSICVHLRSSAVPLLTLLFASSIAQAENWPKWRGPNNDGIVQEKNLPDSLPASGPKELWRASTGIGYASPVAADGKVYFFYLADNKDILEAFDAATGKSLWKQSCDNGYNTNYPGTRCTPVIDADRIYTYGGNGQLIARNLADGAQIWKVEVLKETNGHLKEWGVASTPLINGDVMYLQAGEGGNAAVCISKKDGSFVWKSEAIGAGYASPALADIAGKRQLICFGHKSIFGMDPKTGKTLWSEPWETQYDINATLPIVHDGKVFITCAYNTGRCALYEVADTGVKKVWDGKQVTSRFQPGILENGVLYANSEGTLKCIDFATGKTRWATPNNEKGMLGIGGTIVRYNDKLLCLSERGKLTLIKATPEGYTKISEAKSIVAGDQTWSTPLIYDGKLYVKGKDEVVCFSLK